MQPDRFAVARRTLADRLITALAALFGGLGSWRDRDAARFLAEAVPLVEGAQRTLGAHVGAHVAEQATAANDRRVAPVGVDDRHAVDLRHGVTTRDVYHRPFVTLYTALSRGDQLDRAVEVATTRLREVAELDLQQTYAEASRAAMRGLPAEVRPRYWRRRLVGEQNCALCVLASTQRYTIATLNPIHPGCDCEVDPLFGAAARQQVIDPARLEQVHAAVKELTGKSDAGGRAPDYRQIMTTLIDEHGEVGPMLARPRRPAKPATSPPDRQPEAPPAPEPHRVSADTARRVDEASTSLPQTRDEWNAPLMKEQPAPVFARLDEERAKLDELQRDRDARVAELEAEFKRKRTPRYKRHDMLAELTLQLDGQIGLQRNLVGYFEGVAAKANDDPATWIGQDRYMLTRETHREYPVDANGALMPPPEYHQHLDSVLAVGDAILGDFEAARAADAELARLQADLDAATNAAVAAERRADPAVAAATKAYRAREQRILVELLASLRPVGGVQQTLGVARSDVRGDFEALVREAETVYPDDWLRLADARGPLNVEASDRAFFRAARRSYEHDVIAFARDDYDPWSGYSSYAAEVTAHEVGHRMESAVPGLTHLEFTMVRRRATADGVLEPVTRLADRYPRHAYGADEIALVDEWDDAYAGKTYEASTSGGFGDPASQSWELFQVGTQDTFGRSNRSFGGDDARRFTLGALALLGRG